MFEKYPDIITINHLIEMLNIGKSSAYALLRKKMIKHVRVGKKYIISKSAVIAFLNEACYNEIE